MTSIKCCEGDNITRVTFIFASESGGIPSPPAGTYHYDSDMKYNFLNPKHIRKIDFTRFRTVNTDTTHLGLMRLWDKHNKIIKKWQS